MTDWGCVIASTAVTIPQQRMRTFFPWMQIVNTGFDEETVAYARGHLTGLLQHSFVGHVTRFVAFIGSHEHHAGG
jgi:hypothetical protein